MLERLFHGWPRRAGYQSGRPLYSVVLGSYNRLPLLRHAIASVRRNGGSMRYETIVVDGGSSDGSLEWLLQQKDVITIVQHNRGEFQGRQIERRSWGYFMNLGFKAAQGKYILMISDDCVLLPGAIERGIARFEAPSRRRLGGVAFYFRNWPEECDYYVQRTLGGRLMVNHGLFLRDALEAVGWIDEDSYLFYKADGDLCLRLWQAGYQIVDAPGAFVEHFVEPGEAVRLQNNKTLEQDKKAYAARWNHLVLASKVSGTRMGKELVTYEDTERTAERCFALREDADHDMADDTRLAAEAAQRLAGSDVQQRSPD